MTIMRKDIDTIDTIRSKTLQQLAILSENIWAMYPLPTRNNYIKMIMNDLGCSQRTAYDYFNCLCRLDHGSQCSRKLNESLTKRKIRKKNKPC